MGTHPTENQTKEISGNNRPLVVVINPKLVMKVESGTYQDTRHGCLDILWILVTVWLRWGRLEQAVRKTLLLFFISRALNGSRLLMYLCHVPKKIPEDTVSKEDGKTSAQKQRIDTAEQ